LYNKEQIFEFEGRKKTDRAGGAESWVKQLERNLHCI
jgi:hypothetical protein